MNKRPPQSPIGMATGGSGPASISIVSSVSSGVVDDVVVVVVVVVVAVVVVDVIGNGGKYVGFDDVVDSYDGRSATVVDSMPIWPTSITIASLSINYK